MELIAKKGKANAKRDRLEYVRRDGSRDEIEMPRQGILPHDLVHCVVESTLQLADGFMGRVAKGASPQFAEAGNLEHTEALKIAESTVEAMQTQLASGQFDYDAFLYGVETACASRQVYTVARPDPDLASLAFTRAVNLNETWRAVPPMQTLSVIFPE